DRSLDERNVEIASPLSPQVPNSVRSLRSQSITLGQNHRTDSSSSIQELFRRVRSANDGQRASISSPNDTEGFSTPSNRRGTEVSSDESDTISRTSPSGLSTFSDSAVEPAVTPNLVAESSMNALDLTFSRLDIKEDLHRLSPPSVL
ncbi:U-box domain-containing protein 33-like, partial [Trifolium medium]|nr:U-box domain-containing protein 33-like [Trifolium medium]